MIVNTRVCHLGSRFSCTKREGCVSRCQEHPCPFALCPLVPFVRGCLEALCPSPLSALRIGVDAVPRSDARHRAKPQTNERGVEGGAARARGTGEREQPARIGDADEAADSHTEQARLEAAHQPRCDWRREEASRQQSEHDLEVEAGLQATMPRHLCRRRVAACHRDGGFEEGRGTEADDGRDGDEELAARDAADDETGPQLAAGQQTRRGHRPPASAACGVDEASYQPQRQ
mmetsp:Transcript_16706/g.33769  ORF Transcript_16706/g.33769 Transcript_16706/m.33769 type:complete len:232 (+) Transcript_16706:121-816(+)